MAQISIALDFDLDDESQLPAIMDAVFTAVSDEIGESPSMGLQVDGEHRDPDDPDSGPLD